MQSPAHHRRFRPRPAPRLAASCGLLASVSHVLSPDHVRFTTGGLVFALSTPCPHRHPVPRLLRPSAPWGSRASAVLFSDVASKDIVSSTPFCGALGSGQDGLGFSDARSRTSPSKCGGSRGAPRHLHLRRLARARCCVLPPPGGLGLAARASSLACTPPRASPPDGARQARAGLRDPGAPLVWP
jgi:hypothetical protein